MPITKEQVVLSLYQAVRTLSETVSMKETYAPAGHQHAVANIAQAIGQVMNLDGDVIDGIRVGATLQDFGMGGIPPDILNKRGKLTEAEYETVKQHPVHGLQLLRNIDFPWPVGRMILQHHERMDGSGYPGGIKGDDIVLEARIIAVADVVNSMSSPRPWRRAFTISEALEEIKKYRGTKYDSAVVDACVEIYTSRSQLLTAGENYGQRG